ncbi:N-acetylglucosamine-6-phosphate deacetylase [Neoactinobaculum massilliense]|uniref:N-acetylglucosamine-6-phosphate deacetylase n=1 Tax=Neoactinobaculum massilliense TaxID=2364794 RepID=UPI000F52FC07|nr:amidohydrolase family protein [Neoactinobaculum massilliense]
MAQFFGRVFDGFGRELGTGVELNPDGQLTSILTSGDPGDGYIIPGLIDAHEHGAGGFSYSDDPEPAHIATAIETHLAAGTTAMLASLVSMKDPLPVIQALVPFCESGQLAGIHLEGPFVSVEKKGAQNPAAIRDIDLDELHSWLEAGRGWLKTMTIAPERAHAQEAANMLLDFGGKPSWGHTSATAADARSVLDATVLAARERGRSDVPQTVTHLFNGMFDPVHRTPGPVREFVQAARQGNASLEIIADGHHIAPELVEDMWLYLEHVEGFGEAPAMFFITDSLSAAGMEPGHYVLGGLAVEVRNGACYLEGQSSLAGGYARLSDQFALFARRGRLSVSQLVRACVAGPARALALTDHTPGVTLHYRHGEKPSFLTLDADFNVTHVVRDGVLVR